MLRRLIMFSLFIGALSLLLVTKAGAETFVVDPAHSSIGFSVRHIFTPVKGSFAKFSGHIGFDEKSGQGTEVGMTVEVKSVDTQNTKRDDHLRGADFFAVEKFPKASFKSKKIKKVGKNKYKVTGNLTIHGVTKEVVLDGQFLGATKNPWGQYVAGFSASTTIDRKEFGINYNKVLDSGGMLIGNEVTLSIQIEAFKEEKKAKPKAKGS